MTEYLDSFDETISSDVSLSKILDAFILDDEDVSTIIEFLKQHESDFKNIIANSLHWMRLFQVDFILRCRESEIQYLIDKLKSIPGKIAAYCCWQILSSNSRCADYLKYKFRKEISWILENFNTSHPYKKHISRFTEAHDSNLFELCTKHSDMSISDYLNILDYTNLSNFLKNLDASLFKYRILQLDVFQELSDINKLIYLKSIKENYSDTGLAYIQILTSNEPLEVKSSALDEYYSRVEFDSRRNIYDEFAECKSFGEMMLKISIDGNINQQKLMIRLIDCHKIELLKQWKDFDEVEFNNILNIGDLIEFKYNELKKAR